MTSASVVFSMLAAFQSVDGDRIAKAIEAARVDTPAMEYQFEVHLPSMKGNGTVIDGEFGTAASGARYYRVGAEGPERRFFMRVDGTSCQKLWKLDTGYHIQIEASPDFNAVGGLSGPESLGYRLADRTWDEVLSTCPVSDVDEVVESVLIDGIVREIECTRVFVTDRDQILEARLADSLRFLPLRVSYYANESPAPEVEPLVIDGNKRWARTVLRVEELAIVPEIGPFIVRATRDLWARKKLYRAEFRADPKSIRRAPDVEELRIIDAPPEGTTIEDLKLKVRRRIGADGGAISQEREKFLECVLEELDAAPGGGFP